MRCPPNRVNPTPKHGASFTGRERNVGRSTYLSSGRRQLRPSSCPARMRCGFPPVRPARRQCIAGSRAARRRVKRPPADARPPGGRPPLSRVSKSDASRLDSWDACRATSAKARPEGRGCAVVFQDEPRPRRGFSPCDHWSQPVNDACQHPACPFARRRADGRRQLHDSFHSARMQYGRPPGSDLSRDRFGGVRCIARTVAPARRSVGPPFGTVSYWKRFHQIAKAMHDLSAQADALRRRSGAGHPRDGACR